MSQAVVLHTGRVVKLDSVNVNNAIGYYNNGAVKNFYSNDGKFYISIHNKEYGLDNGEPIYVLESQYNLLKKEYLEKKELVPRSKILNEMIYSGFVNAEVGDEVKLPIREQIILNPGNIHKFCTGIASWSFDGNHFDNFSSIAPTINAITNSQVDCQIIDSQYQDFINKHGTRVTASGETININTVADIAEILSQLKNEDPDYYNLLQSRNLLPVFNSQISYFSQDVNTDFYFYGNEDYEEYRDFILLYKQWFDFQRDKISQATDPEKSFLLISMFNEKELEYVDVADKISILKVFSRVALDDSYWLNTMPYRRESMVIKLIKSIRPDQADQFLDALLYPWEGDITRVPLFKVFYEKLDDNRVKRYPFVLDLGIYKDNKKRYVNALTKIWRYSKYCPVVYNDTNGFTDIKDNCYFFNQGLGYFVTVNSNGEYTPVTDSVLEFGRVEGEVYDTRHSGLKRGRDYRNTYTILPDAAISNDNKVKILKTTYFSEAYYNQDGNVFAYDDGGEKTEILQYHIYQPITLLHYTSDFDLRIPQDSLIPAFLFYYAEDYDKLKDLDATYSFAIQVGIEVALFLVSGGTSTVRQLLYLRRLSNFGRAVDGTLTTANVLIKYKQLDNLFQTASLTTSIVSSHYDYLANTTNNQADFEKYQTQRNLFGLFALGTGVASLYTSYKLPKTCSTLASEIDAATSAGISFEIPPQIKDVVLSIGDLSIYYPALRNKLVDFGFPEATGLVQKLDGLTVTNKVDFYFEFVNKDQAFFQAIHSYNDGIGVNHWRDLKFHQIPERYEIEVLTNTSLVQGYQQFYAESTLGTILNTVTISKRKAFIDIFKDIDTTNFNKFVTDPTLINKWFRYFDDAVLRSDFLILNLSKQLEFVEFFGNLSNYWFKRFKLQPTLFNRFNSASLESKLLAQSNPKLWIRINRYYIRPNDLGQKLTTNFMRNKFKTNYAETLVDLVENRAQEFYVLYKRTFIDKNYQLVAGMVDKESGIMSEFFTNFTKEELYPGGLYSKFLETNTNPVLNMHPNLRNIVNDLQGKQSLYNMDSFDNLVYTGKNIAAHAEIRALDNLIKKKFGYNLVDEDTFYIWLESNVLGYNRNIVAKPDSNQVIMPRCADCFYITDLVTFINNF